MVDVIKLTQKIIQCPSVTPKDQGAQNVLKNELVKLGFTIFDLPFDGNGSYPVKNFFARLGSSGKHICYAGHTDVVPTGDVTKWSHPPFDAVIDDGILYGRGTSDMKGANCAFVASVSSFLQKNKDFDGTISFLITGDEEADAINGTVRVLEWMNKNNYLPDVCLVGESSNIKELGEEIKIGRRGSLSGTLKVIGKQGHVAYPQMADNPMSRLAQCVDVLSNYHFDDGDDFFPPTNLEVTSINTDNTARNVIPASGEILFNIRFNPHWTMDSLDNKLNELISGITHQYDLKTGGNALPFITKLGDWTELVQKAVFKKTGKQAKFSTSGGTSDARFISKYCSVVEFGLTNETIHQIDENLRISDLHALVDIYEDILTQFLT